MFQAQATTFAKAAEVPQYISDVYLSYGKTSVIIAQKGKNEMPLNKDTGIRFFSRTDTVNLESEEYGYNDTISGLYIFCETKSNSAADEGKTSENIDT